MNIIDKTSVYAIKALLYIYSESKKKNFEENRYVLAPHIAKKCDIPKFYLSKTLDVLVKNGILKSAKGKKGGYAFAMSPKQITLYDIIKPFQSLYIVKSCIFQNRTCKLYDDKPDTKGCILHNIIKETSFHFYSRLKNITLENVYLENLNPLNNSHTNGNNVL